MNSNNVTRLRPIRDRQPFDRLTGQLILMQHRQGKLPEAVLVALLAAVGLAP